MGVPEDALCDLVRANTYVATWAFRKGRGRNHMICQTHRLVRVYEVAAITDVDT